MRLPTHHLMKDLEVAAGIRIDEERRPKDLDSAKLLDMVRAKFMELAERDDRFPYWLAETCRDLMVTKYAEDLMLAASPLKPPTDEALVRHRLFAEFLCLLSQFFSTARIEADGKAFGEFVKSGGWSQMRAETEAKIKAAPGKAVKPK